MVSVDFYGSRLSLVSLPLPLLLRSGRPLARRLEHCALDGCDALLEAGRASPREASRGCKLIGELAFGQARI